MLTLQAIDTGGIPVAQMASLGHIRVHGDGCLRDGGERAAVEITHFGIFERQN